MKKGENKYGLKLEDFDSYEDYKKALKKVHDYKYTRSEKGKLRKFKSNHNEKSKLDRLKYRTSEKGKLTKLRTDRVASSKRRASKLQRTVPWSNLEEIANFYKACPKGYQVDHIIPLQGENVSGLHVLNNLQYLTRSENASKGNKYEHR